MSEAHRRKRWTTVHHLLLVKHSQNNPVTRLSISVKIALQNVITFDKPDTNVSVNNFLIIRLK